MTPITFYTEMRIIPFNYPRLRTYLHPNNSILYWDSSLSPLIAAAPPKATADRNSHLIWPQNRTNGTTTATTGPNTIK